MTGQVNIFLKKVKGVVVKNKNKKVGSVEVDKQKKVKSPQGPRMKKRMKDYFLNTYYDK